MARIREALGRTDTMRILPENPVPAPRPNPCPDVARSEDRAAVAEEEVPFIEVGGRGTPMEASPSVLAHTPKASGRRQQAERALSCTDKETRRHGDKETDERTANNSVSLSPCLPVSLSRLKSVAFLPFPPEPLPLSPVPERFDRELVAIHQPDHPISEQYRTIVNNLEKQLTAVQSQVLLFTTAAPGIDTAAVLLNLAITHARQAETPTIVVDANLRRPNLAERLGLPAAPGLKNVLAGLIALPRAVQETGQPNLYALTAGKTTQENIPSIAGESLRAVLSYLRTRFDRIFVNAPCWDGRPEVITLGSGCDAVYLVIPEAEAQTDAVEEVSQRILQQGGCLQGYVLVSEEQGAGAASAARTSRTG